MLDFFLPSIFWHVYHFLRDSNFEKWFLSHTKIKYSYLLLRIKTITQLHKSFHFDSITTTYEPKKCF